MGNVVSVAATDMFSNVSLTTRGLVFFLAPSKANDPSAQFRRVTSVGRPSVGDRPVCSFEGRDAV